MWLTNIWTKNKSTNKQTKNVMNYFLFKKTWEQTQEWKWYGHAAIKRSGEEGKKTVKRLQNTKKRKGTKRKVCKPYEKMKEKKAERRER